jgi:hypothetical protein
MNHVGLGNTAFGSQDVPLRKCGARRLEDALPPSCVTGVYSIAED